MFFPFCFNPHQSSYKEHQRNKLKMLKAVRDSLETRLSAINAAIETIERKVAEEENSTAS